MISGVETKKELSQNARRLNVFCEMVYTLMKNCFKDWSQSTSLAIILSRERVIKVLIRLHICTGWSTPLFFACNQVRLSHIEAHIESSTWFSTIRAKIIMESSHYKPTTKIWCVMISYIVKKIGPLLVLQMQCTEKASQQVHSMETASNHVDSVFIEDDLMLIQQNLLSLYFQSPKSSSGEHSGSVVE